jgi:serine/threonine-protein kinase
MFVVYTLYWLLHGGRAARPPPWPVLIMGLETAVFVAILLWLFYIALEPFVRRLWPETLVSWNRLLAGRWRDPLVGRDVLVGAAFGVLTKLLWELAVLAPAWLGLGPARPTGPQPAPFGTSLRPLLGGRYCVAELFHCQMVAVAYGLTLLLMLLLLRVILRRQRLAAGVYIMYAASLASFGDGYPLVSCPIAAAASAIVVLLLTRFGLLAVVTYWLVRMLLSFPMTANLSAWQAGGTTLLPLAAILALAVCGFYLTQAGRPLIRDTIVR